jgi:hypothetical protein
MPLNQPILDDRSYQQILREALARIPVHNPEWTNFNDSDPGVTLLQLFAFMSESLLYRANQIPRDNRLKFLNLLGIGLQAAAPATGFVVIRSERGPLEVRTVPGELDVRAGDVRFRTKDGLAVFPVEARVFFKQPLPAPTTDDEAAELDTYRLLYADLLEAPGVEPAFYTTAPLPGPAADGTLPVVDILQDTVDGCLWIALLARKGESPATAREAIAGKPLTVGVMPYLAADVVTLGAGQSVPDEPLVKLHWEIMQPVKGGRYAAIIPRSSANILATPGLVELTLPGKESFGAYEAYEPGEEGTGDYPPSLVDTDFRDRIVTWLRLRVERETTGGTVQARVSWLDINAARVVQETIVRGEVVGEGSGEPDQTFTLANRPVNPESLTLTVGGVPWYPISDLLAAAPEVRVENPRLPLYESEIPPVTGAQPQLNVYMLDPESGVITFGDGAHGARPRRGERIVADYRFGGGRQGNLGASAINRSPQLPAGFKVENPIRTWGGDDAESPDDAEKTIPRQVAHRDRLVSAQDFEDVTQRTPGVDIGRVEVLPLYDGRGKQEGVPGAVTVMVIPRFDALSPDAPRPDRLFLETVCRYLQPRRLVTSELHVHGPVYKDIYVSVGLEIMAGRASAPVIDAVRDELRAFLHPLTGGRDGLGYPMDTPVLQRELEAIVTRVDGVKLVSGLLLGGATGGSVSQVAMGRLELPRLVGLAVAVGTPSPLDSLLAAPPVASANFTPIPVVPDGC